MSFSADITAKLLDKRDAKLEAEVLSWIQAILGEVIPSGPFEDVLRDGVILCKLMNKLQPGSCPRINTSGSSFKLMENISLFQKAAKQFGVPEIDVFQTVDLFEKRSISQVTRSLIALGRTHPEFDGPFLGPKPAEERRREFSKAQLRASEGIIGRMYGSSKGAGPTGISFGNTRHM